jgi:hypothetical protein
MMNATPAIMTPGWMRVAPFVPLLIALFEIAWIIVLVMSQMGSGTLSTDNSHTHSLDIIAMIPALIGLSVGILAVVRGLVHRPLEWIFLVIGCLACGLFVFMFGWELFS